MATVILCDFCHASAADSSEGPVGSITLRIAGKGERDFDLCGACVKRAVGFLLPTK